MTGLRMDPYAAAASLMIALSMAYSALLVVGSRRTRLRGERRGHRTQSSTATRPLYIFMLPCLNEGRVIGASVERLLSLPDADRRVLVVDDDSDDDTADVVRAVGDPRVHVLTRRAPNARQGKGEALNYAVQHILQWPEVQGRSPDEVIVGVVDADGRLEQQTLSAITPYFAAPAVGAVQIGVRINNRFVNWLARAQDMEFVIYTEVFQRGRRHLGSVGLGGNGQFMRLSALLSVSERPWSRSLTEDLDLGIRLQAQGWRNEFCHEAAVHQQGVAELKRLIRQRTRWFQGHLQSVRLIPLILRSAPPLARIDGVYHLISPFLLLVASLLTASFATALLGVGLRGAQGEHVLGWWMLTAYLLAAGPAAVFTAVYWRIERANGLTRRQALVYGHLYLVYGLIWYCSGWWAIWRVLRRQNGWAKTARTVESAATTLAPEAVLSSVVEDVAV